MWQKLGKDLTSSLSINLVSKENHVEVPAVHGLYNSPSDRTKSPKFPYTRRRNPSCGSDNDSVQPVRR
ncbi:hypothetical protein P7K49_005062, partial [Saguinus oedipus]